MIISLTLISIALAHTSFTADFNTTCSPLTSGGGCYRVAEDRIFIRNDLSWRRTREVFYHEMAHRLGIKNEKDAEDFKYYALGIIKSTKVIQEIMKK